MHVPTDASVRVFARSADGNRDAGQAEARAHRPEDRQEEHGDRSAADRCVVPPIARCDASCSARRVGVIQGQGGATRRRARFY